MEGLRFDQLADECRARVVLGSILLLPVEIALEVKELIAARRSSHHPALAIFLCVLHFIRLAKEPNVLVHSDKQKVEEELFDAKLGVCPVLGIKLLLVELDL